MDNNTHHGITNKAQNDSNFCLRQACAALYQDTQFTVLCSYFQNQNNEVHDGDLKNKVGNIASVLSIYKMMAVNFMFGMFR